MNITPLVDDDVRKLLGDVQLISEITDAHGGVVHLIFPERIRTNVRSYRSVFEATHTDGDIMFAVKANKASSFLEMASLEQIGAEVSSIHEYRAALGRGVSGKRMVVSGPSKTPECLLLALKVGSLVSIDSMLELSDLAELARRLDMAPARIMARVGDLQEYKSRFGFRQDELRALIAQINKNRDTFIFEGFSFHLEGYSLQNRVAALSILLPYIGMARSAGLPASLIDIGGGFTCSYVSAEDWQVLQGATAKDFFGERKPRSFYPYHSSESGSTFLQRILESRVAEQRVTLADALRKEGIRIFIEPGRSLLNQAGVTCVKVKESRITAAGDAIVNVDANINSLSEQWFFSDFLPGPILITNRRYSGGRFTASVGGNTCMEFDLITRRKVHFPMKPERGDILMYMNTAGYQMDSNESTFHHIPVADKIALFNCAPGKVVWKRDAVFSQLDVL